MGVLGRGERLFAPTGDGGEYVAHPVTKITQPAAGRGYSGRRYGSFAAKQYIPPPTSGLITQMTTDAQRLSARVHRLSGLSENPIELYYQRDGVWHLFPIQPLAGPVQGLVLSKVYKQPATLTFTLPDPDGMYAAEDLNSPYNLNAAGAYDPLLDEARKITLRVGTKCYTNLAAGILPAASVAPSAGPLYVVTDGILRDIASTIAGYVSFAPVDTTPITLSIDLGGAKEIHNAVIRFGTNLLAANCTLPASVQLSLSLDNVKWLPLPVRPVGGTGGDWDDSPVGNTPEFAFCDIDRKARYIRFTIVPTGAQTIAIDEAAVYGGATFQWLGANVFTGYLGDQIDFTPEGSISCIATDVTKRLADNASVFLTAAYRLTSAGAVELADIVYSLLTSQGYWRRKPEDKAYDSPWQTAEIGWKKGSGLTGLRYPLWQGQTNSILGYCMELFNTVGWFFYGDGNGVLQAVDPPTIQRVPDRMCIAAPDGNTDIAQCKRHRTGKLLRNRVVVQTGKSASAGSGSITLFEPNSLTRYGDRTTRITDPLASTTELRQRVAQYFLRDYAWNLQTLTAEMRPQFETELKQVFGIRAPGRPRLYSKASTVVGSKRKQELWSLVSIRHDIRYGSWTASCEFIPYVPQIVDAPNFTALNVIGGDPTELDAVFDEITDVRVLRLRFYVSTESEFTGFVLHSALFSAGETHYIITGLTEGVQVWVYITSLDAQNNESIPSQILTGVPGSVSQALTCYTITDFTISSILTQGPDGQGYYTYQFLALWTAPACGFTQDDVRAFVGDSPPKNPEQSSSWPVHEDSWNWWAPDRILQGLTWDNQTPGQLDFVFTFRSKSNLSGKRMYWRIWNSARTRAWRPVIGNYDFCTVM